MNKIIRVVGTSSCLFVLLVGGCAPPRHEAPTPTDESRAFPEFQPGARTIEAASLLNAPLLRPEFDAARRRRLEADLAEAKRASDADPSSEDAIIWYGRRLAYLGRYNDAITIFADGLRQHPDSSRLRRHLGHRLITVRRFAEAAAVLRDAATLIANTPDAVEPDGQPNAANVPRTTTHFNIWYHLGLALYLQGDFARALDAWRSCMVAARANDDMLVAATHWTYMTLRRLDRDAEAQEILAPISEDMDVIENHAYHELLLMYRGERDPEDLLADAELNPLALATVGYGVGNWHLCEDDEPKAFMTFQRIVQETGWPAFGHIAAEAEIARRRARN